MDIKESIQSAFKNYQSGDLRRAKDICAEILKEQPDNAEILYLLGIAHAQLEEYDPAIRHIERSLQFNRTNADALLALGAIFQKKGLLDEAINYYQKSVEIDPDLAEAYENLGDIFRDKGQFDEAITYYKRAIKYLPDAAEIYLSMGNIFLGKRQLDLAVFYYRKALHYKPDYAEACNNLGIIFHQQGRLDEAVAYYQKALQYDPNFCDACINLGDASQEKRRQDEAANSRRHRLGLAVTLGFLKVEMTINAVINQFYFNKLNVQFHPGDLDAGQSSELRQKILKKIFSDIQKIDNVDKFFADLKRLDTIRKYFSDTQSETAPFQNENSPVPGHKNTGRHDDTLERLHNEFMLTAAKLEDQLVEILHSPWV